MNSENASARADNPGDGENSDEACYSKDSPPPSSVQAAHVLTTVGGLFLTKRWRLEPDGLEYAPYDKAMTFTSREVPIRSIHKLSTLLSQLERDPHSCIVRGRRQAWCVDEPTIRRLLRDRPEEPDGRATLEECPRQWLHLDIDSVPIPGGLSITHTPTAVIETVIREYLPAELHDVTMGWQFSSSAGMPRAKGVVKAHLWWYLSRAVGHDELMRWARHHNLEGVVDVAVFRPSQPNYTARPIFEGLEDPLPERSGMLRYDRDVARLTIPPSTTTRSAPKRRIDAPEEGVLDKVASIFYGSAPVEGEGRNDAHLALANLAADLGMDEEQGAAWVASCLPPRAVPRPREALDAMRDALRRKDAGEERRYGWPTLARLFSDDTVDQVKPLLFVGHRAHHSDADAPYWAEQEDGMPYDPSEKVNLDAEVMKLLKRLQVALKKGGKRKEEPVKCDFDVVSVVISASDPPTYRLVTSDGALTLSSVDLFGHVRFRRRYAETLRRLPVVPTKRDQWDAVVNGWLAQATVEELGPEASRDGYVEMIVENVLQGLPQGDAETPADLSRGLWVAHDGKALVALLPLVRAVQAQSPTATSTEVTRALKALGATPLGKIRLPGWTGTARAWSVPLLLRA